MAACCAANSIFKYESAEAFFTCAIPGCDYGGPFLGEAALCFFRFLNTNMTPFLPSARRKLTDHSGRNSEMKPGF